MNRNDLMKEFYDVSKLKIKNDKLEVIKHPFDRIACEYNLKQEEVSEYENKLTEEDKLEIIDSHTDGLGSYLLKLIDQYQIDRNDEKIFKRTSYGSFNQLSVKKWIKNNDPRNATRCQYNESYPTYYLFGSKFRMTRETPKTDFGYKMLYDGQSVVHQWFHLLLQKLLRDEEKYFVEHDERHVNIKKVWETRRNIEMYLDEFTNDIDDKSLQEVNELLNNINKLFDIIRKEK